MDIELPAVCVERDGLQKEVEQLKLLSEKSMERIQNFKIMEQTVLYMNRKNEIKFQKESSTKADAKNNYTA